MYVFNLVYNFPSVKTAGEKILVVIFPEHLKKLVAQTKSKEKRAMEQNQERKIDQVRAYGQQE